MSLLARVEAAATAASLEVAGICPVLPQDGLGAARSLVLLSPGEPGFWPAFTAAPEAQDGAANSLDRWSARVIGAMAEALGAQALFPFGGPPWRPFIAWSERTGRVWPSPVGLMVHETSGLFFSIRGALAFAEPVPATTGTRPCDTCAAKPCLTSCPARALTEAGYDVATCHSWLDSAAGSACMIRGCGVRLACPVGAERRAPAQSAFHMKAFHP